MKRANADRIKMFSRNLRVINREEEAQIAARREEIASSSKSPVEASAAAPAAASSKHAKAREYAKAHVPKPRVRPAGPVSSGAFGAEVPPETTDIAEELDALALLERQHQEHKAQAALIRAELGL